jgi:hypothetical protein
MNNDPVERALTRLESLSSTQFQKVLLFYEVPNSEISQAGTQGEQAIAIVKYASQKEGEQLTKLLEVINKVAPNNKVAHPKKYKVNFGDLRPHLPNRRPQERKLGKAIKGHCDKQRPLLCLIHGEEYQCNERFVDRLAEYYLPTVVPGDGITSCFVHCDFSEDIDELHQEISQQLASSLKINPLAPPSEIVDAIIRERSPIIFHTDMCTKNWSRCEGVKVVYNFIEFWAKLALPSTHSHLLLICLYFNYKDVEQANFFKRLFKKKSINDQIREEFRQLENENFLEKFGINGIVLPELVNIEKEDVEAWAKEHLRSVWDIVRPKIADLFTSPDETMAMYDLARELRKILEEFPPDVFGV